MLNKVNHNNADPEEMIIRSLQNNLDGYEHKQGIVLTLNDLIRQALVLEFGQDFINNIGIEDMILSIRRGLSMLYTKTDQPQGRILH